MPDENSLLVDLDRDAAIVLLNWLFETNPAERFVAASPEIAASLWDLEASIERVLDVVFRHDYAAISAAASKAIVSRYFDDERSP
jgi:hypothetical protein